MSHSYAVDTTIRQWYATRDRKRALGRKKKKPLPETRYETCRQCGEALLWPTTSARAEFCGDGCLASFVSGVPTPEELAELCAIVRKFWSAKETRKRHWHKSAESWTVPVLPGAFVEEDGDTTPLRRLMEGG